MGSYLVVPAPQLGAPFSVRATDLIGGDISVGVGASGDIDEVRSGPDSHDGSLLSQTTALTATTASLATTDLTATSSRTIPIGAAHSHLYSQHHHHQHATQSQSHTQASGWPAQVPPSPRAPTFTREPILRPPTESALSALLASQSPASDNPFTTLYAAISGRAETASVALRVYFPHSPGHAGDPLELRVRKDATVEEVIGFRLWAYWDEGCEPRLDDGLDGDDDPRRAVRLSAVGWCLRIVEDDGEVDEDFPGALL